MGRPEGQKEKRAAEDERIKITCGSMDVGLSKLEVGDGQEEAGMLQPVYAM